MQKTFFPIFKWLLIAKSDFSVSPINQKLYYIIKNKINRVLLTLKILHCFFSAILSLLFIQIHAASEMLGLPFYDFAVPFS